MKRLEDILKGVDVKSDYNAGLNISGLSNDSRKVKPGYLFVAYKGNAVDGHTYIERAIINGATVIVLEDSSYMTDGNIDYILVSDARKITSRLASNFYDNAASDLTIVGVTGTNGKTTVATLLYKLLSNMGYKSGLISTVDIRIAEEVRPSKLTTPDPIDIQEIFFDMVGQGVTHVFMEVSSHALHQGRVEDIDFDCAVFTNITHDHLDYHNTFKEYIAAKKLLFDNLSQDTSAVINIDDKNGQVMVQNSKANVYTYALRRPAKFKAKILSNEVSGLHLNVNDQEVFLKLIGDFNAYNALAVYGVAVSLGLDEMEVLTELSNLQTAEGRMDLIVGTKKRCNAIVDYAHTPDALDKVLNTLKELRTDNQDIITVVGAGGDRDKTKRPKMAKIAVAYSDKVILTSDNPRTEDPEEILDDMMEGLSEEEKQNTIRISDRKEAIKMSSMIAKDGDIILIAGKGHEKYQEIMGQRFPFDDKEIISALLH